MDLSRLGPILRTRWGAATDTGPVRPQNEDCWLAEPPLHAVADGMGGHTDGALASSTALRTLAAGLRPDVLPGRRPDLVDLDRAIAAAAVAVAALATPEAPWTAPGTTLTGVLPLEGADNPHWIVFNIGDSRTYLVAGGQVRQLTRDHSARQEIRDHGVLASPLPPPTWSPVPWVRGCGACPRPTTAGCRCASRTRSSYAPTVFTPSSPLASWGRPS